MSTRDSSTKMFRKPVTIGAAGYRVLVAEDEIAYRRSIVRVLEGAGHTVVAVEDGAQAVDTLMKDHFDAVLTDIVMPGMSGIDLLTVVRSYDLDVPIILLTGEPKVETAVAAVEYGALRYLVKPVPNDKLLEAVELAGKLRRLAAVKRQMLEAVGAPAAAPADRAGLESRFEKAIEGMTLAFQPIVSGRTRRSVAFEALLRSSEPSLPHPGAVLEAAERLDRIHDVGRRVRGLAASAFERQTDPAALLFVNLHSSDLLDEDLFSPQAPLTQLAERVVLEITERASLEHVANVKGKIADLRTQGFRIAVDDLGAGYAGLASFATLEPEFVKLDMSLARDVHLSEVRQRLIESMVGLCTELGCRIIVEGVEKLEERDTLLRLGCEMLQGYHFARPGPAFPEVRW